VEIEITPEPTPEERTAIEAALARLLDGAVRDGASPWWQAGLRESVLGVAEEDEELSS
jgi:hypothetical protein